MMLVFVVIFTMATSLTSCMVMGLAAGALTGNQGSGKISQNSLFRICFSNTSDNLDTIVLKNLTRRNADTADQYDLDMIAHEQSRK